MRNFIHSNYTEKEMINALVFLFNFLANSNQLPTATEKNRETFNTDIYKYFESRTAFGEHLIADLLHWVNKEMSEHLEFLYDDVLVFIECIINNNNYPNNSRYLSIIYPNYLHINYYVTNICG